MAGGIAPSPLAEAGGLPTGPDGRVQVPPDPTADGLPGVHVPGDLAAIPGPDDLPPREMRNRDAEEVFDKGRYISPGTWYDADGRPVQPRVHHFVGGATKPHGAALYRRGPGESSPATRTPASTPRLLAPQKRALAEVDHPPGVMRRPFEPREPPGGMSGWRSASSRGRIGGATPAPHDAGPGRAGPWPHRRPRPRGKLHD